MRALGWGLALLVITLGAVALAQEQGAAAAPAAAPPELQRARDVAAALTADLKARLMKEMATGGPVAAVKVCSEAAQEIAKQHSAPGVKVRRVSERWRNPADTPDRWETSQLQRLAAAHAEGKLPDEAWEVIGKEGWRVLRYVKPVVIGGPCLSCHGDPAAIAPEVGALLRERYPEDRATGYRDGDLRGAVSVTVALSGR